MCVAIQTPKICTILFKFLLILVGDGGSPHPLPNTPIDPFDRSRMLMPLLVRLTDSQVDVADGMVSEVADRIHHGRRISEQVGSGRLTIDQEALLPDLHIKASSQGYSAWRLVLWR